MWATGTIDGYTFHVKHFEEGSDYGINGGRISKLDIKKDNKYFANYDRGWDIKVTDAGARAVLKELLKRYN